LIIPAASLFLIPLLFILVRSIQAALATEGFAIQQLVLPVALVIGSVLPLYGIYRIERATYLLLSPAGLEYRIFGILAVTTWDNIKPIAPSGVYPALHLAQPATAYPPIIHVPILGSRRIPLFFFDYADHSPLARDLQTYGPHIFDSAGRPAHH
jgi:hypothetical protein